ncbi:protein trunk [Drosophila gunungcola]|uniref:protein trunk n=1 Tax=Drosophila gunungcola TaxID=103775 RepID=UPI0022E0E0D5|nr:protein trunk [Drosophila gunungcola]
MFLQILCPNMNWQKELTWLAICLRLLAVSGSVQDEADYCAELSIQSLSKILGQAFNPRYMSIDPPGEPEEKSYQLGYKRSSYELPFYADSDVISVSHFPAWETNHFAMVEKKESSRSKSLRTRSAFMDRVSHPRIDGFKQRPWECSSKINWIDLGLNYFPRYIRSIECIARKCWYDHFNCKPKSFTIKVLRRKTGSCIRINDKLILITAEKFENDYTQLWIWEEIAVNFCCECVMLY